MINFAKNDIIISRYNDIINEEGENVEKYNSNVKEKKETYLLRLYKNLFFQISDYVQKIKKKNGRKNYSFNKFVLDAIEEKIKDENK